MFVHTVFFWLNEIPSGERLAFEQGLASLTTIGTVKAGWWGVPANTPREVVDNSYSYGLTVVFADSAGHDEYQTDPSHLAFLAMHKAKWARVQVYDVLQS